MKLESLVINSCLQRISFLSTYPPRECGIAHFTKDLVDSMCKIDGLAPSIIAMNEKGAIHDYDRRVKRKIDIDDIEDYVRAAEYINSTNVKLLIVQHEFGLFGGDHGEYLKIFLEKLNKPVITTLHTVQPHFDQKSVEILRYIAKRSDSIVVISKAAIDFLNQQNIPYKKCVLIPHGCPKIDFASGESIKRSLGLEGRLVAATFGLISSGKGIEYAIRALPEVVKKDPRIIYLIIGATHPEVRKHEGEKYRNELMELVTQLGLEEHVRFTNRFLTKRELVKYLQATDIYLTPYNSPDQISSGTLIYAVGAGTAVISTPYYHAQEVLANNRGLLCKFRDSASITESFLKLLDDDFRHDIQCRAYKYSRRFLWESVAGKYIKLIKSTIRDTDG